ncbi:2954_t:CDS:2, partial [Entrophospora sp. SA101]
PSSWLQNSFSNHEWSIIKDTSHSHYKQFQTSNCHLLKSGEIRDILNHFKRIHHLKDYLLEDEEVIEGTWTSDGIITPLKIASCAIPDIRLYSPEKQSKASKRRRIISKSDNLNLDKENLNSQKKREPIVGEIAYSPWDEDDIKTRNDQLKLYRMMKDLFDDIMKTNILKYDKFVTADMFKSLEIYGILIKGFQMFVFVLDKPGFGLYRIRKVDELTIPVKEKNDDVIKVYESLMFAVKKTKEFIDELHENLRTKKKEDNDPWLLSSMPPTCKSPIR